MANESLRACRSEWPGDKIGEDLVPGICQDFAELLEPEFAARRGSPATQTGLKEGWFPSKEMEFHWWTRKVVI